MFGAFGRDPFFSDVGGVFGRRRSMFDRDVRFDGVDDFSAAAAAAAARARRGRFDDDDDDDEERCSTNANGEETDAPDGASWRRRGAGGGEFIDDGDDGAESRRVVGARGDATDERRAGDDASRASQLYTKNRK